ncbi:MAG: VOC family protein [Acidobacteriota bacterium]
MAKVNPVPTGYGTVTPFLNIKGASEAIELYKKAFGAEELNRAPGPNNTLMHAAIRIGNSIVMIADAMMGPPTQASLHLYVEDCDALWKRATAAGCKVEMPIADQFWGDRYGVVSDRFGNRWAIASHKEDVPADEMRRRMDKAIAEMRTAK